MCARSEDKRGRGLKYTVHVQNKAGGYLHVHVTDAFPRGASTSAAPDPVVAPLAASENSDGTTTLVSSLGRLSAGQRRQREDRLCIGGDFCQQGGGYDWRLPPDAARRLTGDI